MKLKNACRYVIIAIATIAISACKNDVENLYYKAHVQCVFRHVTAVDILRNALASPGQFCMMKRDNQQFTFQTKKVTKFYTLDALDKQTSYITFSGQGFIVGTTALTELSTGDTRMVAFDRTCPACYDSTYTTRPLEFVSETTVRCSKGHTYDLNNFGLPINGTKSKKLFRYPIFWNGVDMMTISN